MTETTDRSLERIQALIDVGRHTEARRLLAGLLTTEPDDAHALCLLASCHDAVGDDVDMLVTAERAAAAAPDDEWAHRLRALALARLDRTVESVAAARQAANLDPEGWQGRVVLAAAFASDPRHHRRALAAAHDAVRLGPGESSTHFMLGVLLHGGGRYAAAGRAYRRTLACEPGHAGALENLGRLAERHSRIGTSLELFGAAAAAAPGAVDGVGHLRQVLRQMLGLAWATALCVVFVLLWATFPVAWAVAALFLAGAALWAWRTLRRLAPPLRAQLASWLRSDPRYATLAWSTVALLALGVVLGVLASTTVDVGEGPVAGQRMLVLVGVALAGMVVTAVTVKVVERRVGRLPDELRAEAHDPRARIGGRQLFTRFRQLWASGLAAVILVPGADAHEDWRLRAVLGAVVAAAYAWYHLRMRRQPPRPLAPAWDRLAGWYVPVTVAWAVNLVCVLALTVLPDGQDTALGLAAIPPLVLVPVVAAVQLGRLVRRLAKRA